MIPNDEDAIMFYVVMIVVAVIVSAVLLVP
mgnify:CR=1 FL=1